ncbi:MAG TPA: exosortase [Deltaproteobacteria bacterium]|nr:exosortase [Deltaproteobacteria bacterium]
MNKPHSQISIDAFHRSAKSWLWPLFILVLISALYFRMAIDLFQIWISSDEHAHGLLLVAISIYLLFKRRKEIVAIETKSWLPGLFLLIAAIFLFLAGHIAVEYYIQRCSLMVLLLGIIGYIYGKKAFKIFLVPILLLLLAVPLPQIIVNTLTLPLKSLVSSFSAEILRLLDIAVLQEGNILVLPGITLEVVNACSGIRSVFALLVLAFLFSYDMKSPFQRVLLVILTVPLAVFTNSLRITATGILASNWNAETALRFYHDFGGWVIFVVSLVLLFALKKLIHVIGSGCYA